MSKLTLRVMKGPLKNATEWRGTLWESSVIGLATPVERFPNCCHERGVGLGDILALHEVAPSLNIAAVVFAGDLLEALS